LDNKIPAMQFKDVIGQQQVKERLLATVRENRIAHTQLFLGPEGSGNFALAIAFAQYINCQNKQDGDSCGTCPSCVKYSKFAHPDLHFIFPTATTDKVKKNPESKLFQEEWLRFVNAREGYVTQSAWYETLGIGNKQGTIYARDANEIIRLLGFKPYEASVKVVVIFQAERLYPDASNKLLKSLEEPPDNTLIILVAEHYEMILPTVRSRAQLVKVPRLSVEEIRDALARRFPDVENQEQIDEAAVLSNGNWNLALELMEQSDESEYNFIKFRDWMRLCFRGNDYLGMNEMIQELSRLGREKQKKFLQYGLGVIHNSLFVNQEQLNVLPVRAAEKDYLQKFAPYVNGANQKEMYELLNEAVYHIERNAHPGILFADLSFRLSALMAKGKREVATHQK
jgi:DNA polymerase-3 subunit delta'